MAGLDHDRSIAAKLRTRGQTYGALVGLAVGMVLAGMVVPFAVGDHVNDRTAAGTDAQATFDTDGVTSDNLPATGADGETNMGGAPASAAASSTTAPSSTASPTEQRRASDIGVTADSIKLGFFLLDLGAAGKIGFAAGVDADQQQAAFQAYVDEINDRGGINGRKIEASYKAVDVLDENSGGAACRYMTQDAKVFAATGDLLLPADAVCVTRQGKTFFFAGNLYADDTYQSAGGLLTSFGMRGGRLMRNWVAEFDRIHYLDSQKIAILSGESTDPSGSTANALKAALQAAGHPVVSVSRFSADRGTGSAQIPVEVSQTKTSGATSVFLLSDGVYSAQFAQQADSQGYRPRYTTSPWTGNDTDAAMQNMPAGADGMVGVTAAYPFTSWPVTPPAKRCIDTYQTRSGRKLAGPNTNEFIITMLYCDLTAILERMIAAAGVNPTRASLIAAAAKLGPIGSLALTAGGSFGQGKPDFEDTFRFQIWKANCKCYQPSGDFHAVGT